jgi:hypothetical protein
MVFLAAALQQASRLLIPFSVELQIIPVLVHNPEPALGARQGARLRSASGFVFALVEHCVSSIATFDQSSAAANIGSASIAANTKATLFIWFSPFET